VFYYGTPFPNTAYAKLNTGVADHERIQQGLHYLLHTLAFDPITLAGIAFGTGVMLWRGPWTGRMLALGVLLHVFYAVRVGGDFMGGRFLAAPLFAAMAGLAVHLPRWIPTAHAGVVVAVLAVVGLAQKDSPLLIQQDLHKEYEEAVDLNGIADEKGYYFRSLGLLNSKALDHPRHFWRDMGEAAGANAAHDPVVIFGNIGIYGYYAGPQLHIVDPYALADPLLARLPAKKDQRIGHFARHVPAGYVETIRTGINRIRHPGLAAFYDHLAPVVKGPLFSIPRFREILALNAGRYAHLLRSYVDSPHLIVEPLEDLLGEIEFLHHAVGWWGPREQQAVWAVGPASYLSFHATEERQAVLHLEAVSPFDEQRFGVTVNGQELVSGTVALGDTFRSEVPLHFIPGETWIAISFSTWNDPGAPLIPEHHDPVAARITRLRLTWPE
jgi:hypothetical protein